ncbi:MAG: AI-2E family transporter [Ruminococcaceae bacterium]|nr:AI-2E family transporter [Oscillospiraceae bacterium]
MKFDKNSKYNTTALLVLIVVAFAALVFSMLVNINSVVAVLGKVLSVVSPIIYAFLLMLVLLPIADFFEEKFTHLLKKHRNYHKKAKVLSVICAYVLLLLVVALVLLIVVTQATRAYSFAANFADEYVPVLNKFISDISERFSFVGSNLKTIVNAFSKTLSDWLSDFPSVAMAVAAALGNVVSTLSAWVLATIISVYAMFRRNKLKAICRRANAALFPQNASAKVSAFFGSLYRNMVYFYSARAYNMVILAVLYYLALLLMGLEFFSLVALIVAVCSFVPVVGTLIGGGVGLFVVFVTDTDMAGWFVLVFLVLTVLDYVFLRPKITNKKVHVSLGTTIICVFVGYFIGKLLGAMFALPLYVTIRDMFIAWHNKKKEVVKNSADSEV